VPFGFGSLSTLGGGGGATSGGRLVSPGGEVSSGASASSASSAGGRRRPGHKYSHSFAGRLEDEGYGGEESSSEERGRVRRRAKSSGRELEVAAAEFARSGAKAWPARRGRSTEDVVIEDEKEEEEESWGLGKGMELREVSAKDDRGECTVFDVPR
jgi:hypothetical protein